MKKPNNIDDLFARKLSNLERKPSPDLWQRIEQGQKKEPRRLGGWYWYAAASVMILLMAGYLVWQNQSQTVEPQGQMAQTEQMAKPKEEKLDSPNLKLDKTKALASTQKKALASTQKTELAEGASQRQSEKRETFAMVAKANAPKKKEVEQTPILEDVRITKIEKTVTDPKQLMAESEVGKSMQPVQVGIPGTVLTDLLPNRVIVAHVETEDLTNEDQKPSKFLRVMRQLKNAKQGDEVEWDELGFNPKRILARADERLHNGEDKISDKYQELKNKTKL